MTDYILDAGTFQRQLGDLATTLAFKVQREGIKVLGRSTGIADIYVLVRQAQRTIWKDADPDIPILKDAKAEYAKLQ